VQSNGATQTRTELEKIARLCIDHDLIVLTDEIYSELSYGDTGHVSIASLPGMRERTVFLHGFSKAFAMTGFRIGYACAPAILTDAMMKVHQYAILCANTMAQDAAIEALENGARHVAAMRREYEHRRNYIVQAFNDLGLPCFLPHGAFYIFPNIAGTGLTSREFSLGLLEKKKSPACPARHLDQAEKALCVAATRRASIKSKSRWNALVSLSPRIGSHEFTGHQSGSPRSWQRNAHARTHGRASEADDCSARQTDSVAYHRGIA
jgi:aspartate/methionine/tyrosine aminotransferase